MAVLGSATGRVAPAHLVAAATSVDTIRTAACVETVGPAIDSAFLGPGIGSDTLGILVRLLKSASLFRSEDYGVRELCSAELALRIASIENPGAARWTTRCFLSHSGTLRDRFRAILPPGPDDSNWPGAPLTNVAPASFADRLAGLKIEGLVPASASAYAARMP